MKPYAVFQENMLAEKRVPFIWNFPYKEGWQFGRLSGESGRPLEKMRIGLLTGKSFRNEVWPSAGGPFTENLAYECWQNSAFMVMKGREQMFV